MKIGLGTVQFGIDYGISNPDGQTSAEEATEILSLAQKQGIEVIDTAALYGTSEEVLGKALPSSHRFRIVTKTIRIDRDQVTPADAALLEKTFHSSLDRIGVPAVYGLLIHNAADVLARDGELLMDSMKRLKDAGRVQKIGVSVYSGQQIDQVLDRYSIDLIQLPINVLDQRLLHDGHLARLKKEGVEIHARSAFLQGLLLMPPGSLAPHFDSVRTLLHDYHTFLSSNGVSPVEGALGFVSSIPHIDSVICGVNNHDQLLELCRAVDKTVDLDFSRFAISDDSILNPSKWVGIT